MSTSVPAATPLMAPMYLYQPTQGPFDQCFQWALFWDSPSVTQACAASNSSWSTCLDGVVRGALGPLRPQLGELAGAGGPTGPGGSAPSESLFPDEIAFLTQGMQAAGFKRV